MGDVRKMERLEKHLCLGFLFGKTMKKESEKFQVETHLDTVKRRNFTRCFSHNNTFSVNSKPPNTFFEIFLFMVLEEEI